VWLALPQIAHRAQTIQRFFARFLAVAAAPGSSPFAFVHTAMRVIVRLLQLAGEK